MTNNLGEYIHEKRLDRCYTQQELSEKMGISLAWHNMVELGKKNPSMKTLKKYAEALNVPYGKLRDMQKLDQAAKESDRE